MRPSRGTVQWNWGRELSILLDLPGNLVRPGSARELGGEWNSESLISFSYLPSCGGKSKSFPSWWLELNTKFLFYHAVEAILTEVTRVIAFKYFLWCILDGIDEQGIRTTIPSWRLVYGIGLFSPDRWRQRHAESIGSHCLKHEQLKSGDGAVCTLEVVLWK